MGIGLFIILVAIVLFQLGIFNERPKFIPRSTSNPPTTTPPPPSNNGSNSALFEAFINLSTEQQRNFLSPSINPRKRNRPFTRDYSVEFEFFVSRPFNNPTAAIGTYDRSIIQFFEGVSVSFTIFQYSRGNDQIYDSLTENLLDAPQITGFGTVEGPRFQQETNTQQRSVVYFLGNYDLIRLTIQVRDKVFHFDQFFDS